MSFRVVDGIIKKTGLILEKSSGALTKWLVFGFPVLVAVVSRLVPHLPNFTAVGAMALFAGSIFGLSRRGLVIPLSALIISDLYLGFHNTIFYVYGAFVFIFVFGAMALKERSFVKIFGASLFTSMSFFLITNFGVWHLANFYSPNWSGLVDSYVMGLPFLKYEVLGDLFYSGLLFLGYELVIRKTQNRATAKI